ncbi:hypothetical protein CRG98_042829 [Punica granatum]|uniref:Retrotransposon gag domain-containing protein n=1 Tax=Punica granatum TaxID=22663 RepID=A0A2I0HYV3_PUNGR|nr:hypothetical protein CRG98_042829 [Punica granatum]
MRLPSKIKIPNFKRYKGTSDPRHHLRHYQSKMMPYWDYEEFVVQTFQNSLIGSALDWFMTLKADDIPTWADLSHKFLDEYRFCAESPPTLLDLSMMEMKENQAFEACASEWRGKAAKHIPLITERQQVHLFHSTLRGAYYSHLLAHTSSFSALIEAGKKLDMGVKLGRIEAPSRKKERETSKRQTYGSSKKSLSISPADRYSSATSATVCSRSGTTKQSPGFEISSTGSTCPCPENSTGQCCSITSAQGAPGHTLDTCLRLRDKIQEMIDTRQISFNDHGLGPRPSVNMISIAAIEEDAQKTSIPFVINYAPTEVAGSSVPFFIEVPAKESYQDRRVPWRYDGEVANAEQEMSTMGIVSTPFWLTIPNNDISNDPDYDLSRNTENGSTE